MASTAVSVALTVVAVIAVLGLAYYFAARRGLLSGPEETESMTEERMSKASDRSHRRLGMRDRAAAQTPFVKGLMVTVLAFALFVAFNAYRLLSTGSPAQLVYVDQLKWLAAGVVFVGAGTWFKSYQDGKAGELVVKYENADEEIDHSETLYYDRDKARRTEDGTTRLPLYRSYRLLGLVWHPKLVADDPERRNAEERLPSDQIIVEVPSDGSTAWHRDAERVVVRAKELEPQQDPVVDYRVVPSDRKSRSEVQMMQNDMEEMKHKLDQARIEIGILTEKIWELEGVAEQSRRDALEELQDINSSLVDMFKEVTGNGPDPRRRDGTDQTSAIPGSDEGGD